MIQSTGLSLPLPVNPQESGLSAGTADLGFETLLLAGVAAGALLEADGGKPIPQDGKSLPVLPDLPVEELSAAPIETAPPEAGPERTAAQVRMVPVGEVLKKGAFATAELLPTNVAPGPEKAPRAERLLAAQRVDRATVEAARPASGKVAIRVPNQPILSKAGQAPLPDSAAELDAGGATTLSADLPATVGEASQPAFMPVAAEPAPELAADPVLTERSVPARAALADAPVRTSSERVEGSEPSMPRRAAEAARKPAAVATAPARESQDARAIEPAAEPAQPLAASLLPGELDAVRETAAAPEPLPANEPAAFQTEPVEPVDAQPVPAATVPAAPPVALPPRPVAVAVPAEAAVRAEARPVSPRPIAAPAIELPAAQADSTRPALRAQPVTAAPAVPANDLAEAAPLAAPVGSADAPEIAEPDEAPRSAAPARPAAQPPAAGRLTLEIGVPAREPALRPAVISQPAPCVLALGPVSPPVEPTASQFPAASQPVHDQAIQRGTLAQPASTTATGLVATPPAPAIAPARVSAAPLPATPAAQVPIAHAANDGASATPALPNDLLPSPGQEKRAAIGPGQPALQGGPSFNPPSLPNPPLSTQAVAPATLPIPAVDIAGGSPTAPAAASPLPRAHDVAALVDRLVEAREAARGETLHLAVHNKDFGQVSLRFTHDGGALTVAVANDDPEFARAVRAAIPAGEARDGSDIGQGERRDFGGSQGGRQPADASGANGDDGTRRGRSERAATRPDAQSGADANSPPREGATSGPMGGILA